MYWAAHAQNYFNPGTMGPNALPPQRCESPWVGDDWLAELGLGVQIAVPPNDLGPLPGTLTIGTTRRTTQLLSGPTQRHWGTPNSSGLAKADLRTGGTECREHSAT